MPPPAHVWTSRILECSIAGGTALTALIAWTGGFTLDPWGLKIGLHDWVRPSVATLVVLGLHLSLAARAAWCSSPTSAAGHTP